MVELFFKKGFYIINVWQGLASEFGNKPSLHLLHQSKQWKPLNNVKYFQK